MNRRRFLKRSLTLAAATSLGSKALGEAHRSKRPPNVLFVICDDLNCFVPGFGAPVTAHAPAIQSFAESSFRFTNAHSNCPLCGPSRASLWTGLHPYQTGYYGFEQNENTWRQNAVLAEFPTVFESFAAAGYSMYGTGKIFHNNQSTRELFNQARSGGSFGAEHSFGPYPSNGINLVAHPDIRAPWGKHAMESFGPLSRVPVVPPDPTTGAPGYAGWKDFRYVNAQHRDPMPDEQSTQWAARKLSQPSERPFFMAVGFNRPHRPCYAPEEFFDLYPLEEVRLPPYLATDLADCAAILQRQNPHLATLHTFRRILEAYPNQEGWRRYVQAYLACVSFVDRQFGILMEALRKGPNANDTIVVFASDHGFHLGSKDLLSKETLWEESTWSPLIISAPGMNNEGQGSHQPVSLVDLVPTLNELCGISPSQRGPALAGRSLVPCLEGKSNRPGIPAALACIAGDSGSAHEDRTDPKNHHFSLRSERYRYTLCSNSEEEFYDHLTDPYEWINQARNDHFSEILDQHRQMMRAAKAELQS